MLHTFSSCKNFVYSIIIVTFAPEPPIYNIPCIVEVWDIAPSAVLYAGMFVISWWFFLFQSRGSFFLYPHHSSVCRRKLLTSAVTSYTPHRHRRKALHVQTAGLRPVLPEGQNASAPCGFPVWSLSHGWYLLSPADGQ